MEFLRKTIFNHRYFRISFLVVTLLMAIPAVHQTTSSFVKIFLVWGAVILLYELLTKQVRLFEKTSIARIAFLMLYAVTIILHMNSMFSRNFSQLCYMVLYLFLLFENGATTKEQEQKDMLLMGKAYTIIMFLFSLVSFAMFCCYFHYSYHTENGYMNFGVYDNRLWGLYHPNTGGALNAIAIFILIFLLYGDKKKGAVKIFRIINLVLQFFCLCLTQSRTSIIALAVGMAFVVFFVFWKKLEEKNWKKMFMSIGIYGVLAIMTAALFYKGADLVKEALYIIPKTVISVQYEKEYKDDDGEIDLQKYEEMQISSQRIESEEDMEEDSFNGRPELWSCGLKVWNQNKLFGVGYENIYPYGKDIVDETLSWNLHVGGLHNGYLTVLVSSGILGLIPYLLILIILGLNSLKYLWTQKGKKDVIPVFVMIILLFVMMIMELMEARTMYAWSVFGVLFWIVGGYVFRFARTDEKGSE